MFSIQIAHYGLFHFGKKESGIVVELFIIYILNFTQRNLCYWGKMSFANIYNSFQRKSIAMVLLWYKENDLFLFIFLFFFLHQRRMVQLIRLRHFI